MVPFVFKSESITHLMRRLGNYVINVNFFFRNTYHRGQYSCVYIYRKKVKNYYIIQKDIMTKNVDKFIYVSTYLYCVLNLL